MKQNILFNMNHESINVDWIKGYVIHYNMINVDVTVKN